MEIIGYLSCFMVGLILGLIGAGGSLLIIPILVYFFAIDIVAATSYSLIIVGATSMVGVVQRIREASVDLKTGLILGIPSIVTIFITRKWLLPSIPEMLFQTQGIVLTKRHLILVLFSLLIFTASYCMLSKNHGNIIKYKQGNTLYMIVLGSLIGLLTGIVGIGGGFLLLPALIFMAGLPFSIAVGTSLFIIAIKSLTGFTADLSHLTIDWSFLLLIVGFTTAGICSGNIISGKFSSVMLKHYFGWFTLLVGIVILLKETITIFGTNQL